MSKLSECYLHCTKNLHPPILLPHNKEVVLGRSQETKITEKRCSKCQLSFMADCSNFKVKVKQVGPNSSAMNDVILQRNQERIASHGDSVHFLLGLFKHIVLFDPAPQNGSTERNLSRKRHSDVLSESHEGENFHGDNKHSKKDITSHSKWNSIDDGKLLCFESQGLKSATKVAAYDLDGTIIITKSGKVFPQNKEDWKVQWPEIPIKLKALHKDGYKIVFFTNQAGISKGKTSALDIKKKLECIVDELGIPVQIFVATGNSIYRKPAPGMWDYLLSNMNSGEEINMSASFYCGDAAGRPDKWAPKKKKDFSCSDRLFAKNLGLKFFTPEEHFLGQKEAPFTLPDFNPSNLSTSLVDPPNSKLTSDKQELLLMVGFPGSGKSFVCKTHILPKGYIHVNRDKLGSWQKCVSATKSGLEAGSSVVVDNTNPDPESRYRFIELAKKLNITCRCAVMAASVTLAKHNNKFRELIGEDHELVSEMIINSYKSKFKEPQLTEGFNEILKVNFVPIFTNPTHERLFKMYLIDRY